MGKTGFVYAIVGNRTSIPTFIDIRINRIKYNGTALNISFEGLKHYTNYTIFFYGSNDDPTEFQMKSDVFKFNILLDFSIKFHYSPHLCLLVYIALKYIANINFINHNHHHLMIILIIY